MNDGIWLTITEYQNLKNLSVSTIRRYIKAGRVKWRIENKKYMIFMHTEKYLLLKPLTRDHDANQLDSKLEIERLKAQLKILKDERDDLQMLVHLYENDSKNNITLPDLPMS